VAEDFEAFVTARAPALLRRAYLLCGGDQGAAEDLLQDVLERMYPRWRRIHSDPESYARAALANAAANRWRSRARRVAERPLHPTSQGSVPGPEPAFAERDLAVRALAELSPRMRAVLVLRFYEDMSEAQTAAALGCRPGTVKSLTSRGLARMREILGSDAIAGHPR
jgi:RNA polymerase sigma-70 factor (sigma-E family)